MTTWKFSLAAVLLVLTSVCWFVGPAAHAMSRRAVRLPSDRPAIDVGRLEKRIHALVNEERKAAGLPALAWNRKLHEIARAHSRAMVASRFFSHIDREGRSFADRYRQAGFHCAVRIDAQTTCLGGENLAQNMLYRSIVRTKERTVTYWNTEEQLAAGVVRQWMKSPGHRRNILDRYYRQEGIGVSIAEDGKVLVTQDFC